MRPSSRTLILDAAVRVTDRQGITALTLEATAEEAGLTKGGLLYHFRTREDLLLAIQRHLVQGWEERLLAELGRPWTQASPTERGAAYVRVMMRGEVRHADLAFMVEAESNPDLAQIWNELMERWAPTPQSPNPRGLDLFLARLAVDGLWLFNATSGNALPEEVARALRARVAELTVGGPQAPEAKGANSPVTVTKGENSPVTETEGENSPVTEAKGENR
ncbi:TetR/AcrR family transcriptional regulator [Nocardiopsis prasina]|uniref:TetR/AcrR family transcriptional regulator n=1 Tax=Nocardiopsis prasina TaxID=2015 RepID=UPI00034D8C4B|nr:TetR/AcrR family transcriptional regulator [Nocardiopsis prasina]